MPVCCGGPASNPESEKQNAEINKYLRDEKRKLDKEVKLLLLGTPSTPLLKKREVTFTCVFSFLFSRRWRIRQEYHSETDENYSSGRFYNR